MENNGFTAALDKFVESITPAMQSLSYAIINLYTEVAETFQPVIDAAIKTIKLYGGDEIIKSYPNKRVVQLALYHKSARIRKKNRHRIYKDYIRGCR